MESRESVLQAQECEQEQFRSPCAPLFGVQVRKNINMDNVSVFRVERWDTLEKSSSLFRGTDYGFAVKECVLY